MDDHLTNSSPEENSVCLISCVISWSVKVQAGVLIEVAHVRGSVTLAQDFGHCSRGTGGS